jgi:Zn-dependent protease with chaperone function
VVGLFVTWYLGDVSSLLTAVPAALLEARYSRDHEREADEYAARMLRHNAMSPELLVTMLGRLERAHGAEEGEPKAEDAARDRGLPEYLSTHPATAERIEALRRQR